MTITTQEAKTKCIAMWEYIAENIEKKEWRARADLKNYKRLAIDDLKLGFSHHECYLCNLYNIAQNYDATCIGCPLNDTGQRGGMPRPCVSGGPYRSYFRNIRHHHYTQASKAALRLVEKVRAWEVPL